MRECFNCRAFACEAPRRLGFAAWRERQPYVSIYWTLFQKIFYCTTLMNDELKIDVRVRPELDPGFVPAVLWNRAYERRVAESDDSVSVAIALVRPDQTSTVFNTRILEETAANEALSLRYLERILKFLLWQRGGNQVLIAGCDTIAERLAAIYSDSGERRFDYDFFGQKCYRSQFEIRSCAVEEIPDSNEGTVKLGRNLGGCRIGFDLGGSDRKCAAVIDGKAVFTEEVEWDPYFQTDLEYHIEGINDSLRRAAACLPRIYAIGGSTAGVIVNSEVRVSSLFGGISGTELESQARRVFYELRESWKNVPFDVVNDGEVTALAGSMSMGENAVLGLAMGTSQAVGYVTPEGNITQMLNELAFAPLDYSENAPVDEWSGDQGCGALYFSQQAVARLAPLAGLEFPEDMPFPERLIEVQKRMAEGDERAISIYKTIGVYFGYGIAHYADFYDIRKVLLLGRVTSGRGGSEIIETAQETLATEFPELATRIEIKVPGEKDKRHGQAVAAASLPIV